MMSLKEYFKMLEQNEVEAFQAAANGDLARMLELNMHRQLVKSEIIKMLCLELPQHLAA